MVGYRFVTNEAPVSDLRIDAEMEPDLMAQDGTLHFEQLNQLISDQTNQGEWLTFGTSSERFFLSIVTACSADGCKTFTFDGDGNLVPYVQSDLNALTYPTILLTVRCLDSVAFKREVEQKVAARCSIRRF